VRLPYIQVTQETWDNARSLSALLGIDEGNAFKLLCDLWRWGISLGPDESAPTGMCESPRAVRLLAAAVGWTRDDVSNLIDALTDLGLVDCLGDRIRVRGIGRYAAAWEKARKDRERKKSRGIPSEVARKSNGTPGESQGQTQTQTQTQTQQSKTPPPRAREASPYVPLIDRVSDTFRQARGANFKATFADEQAVSELLRKSDGNEDEIVRRFAIGLRRTRFPECHDLVGLAKYWNAYVKAEEPRATSPPRRHEPQTVAKDWANEKEGEVDL
jgi:hypothetical protein